MVSLSETTLIDVATRVVGDYLGLKAHESFLLVTDAGVDHEVSRALVEAAQVVGSDPTHAWIPSRATSGDDPPPAVAAAMAAVDVCLCVASRSIYHTRAAGAAKAAGTRGCFNGPASLDAWTKGAMTADFWEIRIVAERLADRLRRAQWMRVTSPAGSDVTCCTGSREPKGWYTGIVRNPGEVTALPGGEVSFPPLEGTAQGVIVFEKVVTDLGLISEPITIRVEDGLAVAIEGGDDARRLRDLIDGVPFATNIGELGIGLNPVARIGADITETKKRHGTAHMALGDSAGGYGGTVDSPVHLDGMLFDVTISADGEVIVEEGRLLL